ncbi:cyclic nucleotide-binding domain-containing protein [Geoalkalibacter halelectricus]|uniref:Cyclic nucleotide-binding domain-containing protein n=1 Tax=Geoalkalibacter halelectricus TaxID=2847045 RepID=A0ABY5ZPV5_9BACT|nr:cyclic nucleotide-binding domain-containing protein [Geoalkalibacter halelectricus]MDO3379939.1 cyclic nucleotide-binding domain-containing protein [Geoalkalibacter halelectricus]UWZ80534.1 cyclic nucleotide-binding domain-containing protein [Geoalkalibacter halelectricus]
MVFDGLEKSPLLKGLDEGELALLGDCFKERSMDEGTTVFIENMPGESLYLIQRGAVQISKSTAEGEERTLLILGPEEVFGELALVLTGRRPVTARIVEAAGLLQLTRKEFNRLCDRHPRLGMKLMRNILRVFSERVRAAEEDYHQMLRFALGKSPHHAGGY